MQTTSSCAQTYPIPRAAQSRKATHTSFSKASPQNSASAASRSSNTCSHPAKQTQKWEIVLLRMFPPPLKLPLEKKLIYTILICDILYRFKNIEDTIEVRHHVFVKTGYQSVELAEVGPRMSMRLFEIRAGTLDNKEGDVEWHLNQYTRTGRKKDYL